MSGLYFGLSMVAIFVVIHWVISNEGKSADDAARGFLSMKKPGDPAKPAKKRNVSRWQRPTARH
jgi:hypothetical protein